MLKAQAIGNIGSDPEMRYSPSGTAFIRFNVASNGRTRNQSGEWEDKTEWIRVTVFGQRAEKLSEMLHKGSRVFVDGKLEARPWTNNSGQPQAGLELIANEVEFMSARAEDGGRGPSGPVRPLGAGVSADNDDNIPF
jgi:single-strand DNA-binding protein